MALLALLNKQLHRDVNGDKGDIGGNTGELPACATSAKVPQLDFATMPVLHRTLMAWGLDNLPAATDAIAVNASNPDYCRKCLGALFVAAVKADPPWLWHAVDGWAAQVIALSPHIRPITWHELGIAIEGAIPGKLSWRDWIEGAQAAGWLAWGSAPAPEEWSNDAIGDGT